MSPNSATSAVASWAANRPNAR